MSETLKFGAGEWATKVGSTLAYNSENGNFKPLPFNFTRSTSATRVNKDGLIEVVSNNKPRIDFLNDSNGALLLEPARTNLITYSEAFDNAYWTKSGSSVVSGFVSPDGTANAFKLVEDSATSRHTITMANTPVSVANHSASIFVKANGRTKIALSEEVATGLYASFDLTTGTVLSESGISSKIEALADDWYRISYTSLSGTFFLLRVCLLPDSYTTGAVTGTYTGDGTSGVYIWGAQLEQGSYATSYIPTQGSIGTRTVEYSKILNQPILKATNKFTMFFDAPKFLEINGGVGSFSNIMLNLGAEESAYSGGGGLHIYNNVWYYFSGSVATNIGICYNSLTDSKFAISYDGTSFHIYANGVKIGSIALSASMVNWGTFQTGDMADGGLNERSWNLKNLKLYNTALTDAELISLTTI